MNINVAYTHMTLGNHDKALEAVQAYDDIEIRDPSVRVLYPLIKGRIMRLKGDPQEAKRLIHESLEQAQETGLRARLLNIHQQLRDLAEEQRDFDEYVHHSKEFERITNEVLGRESSQKIAVLEAERKIEDERREREKERALLYGALPKSVADRKLRGDDVSADHFDSVSFCSWTSSVSRPSAVEFIPHT